MANETHVSSDRVEDLLYTFETEWGNGQQANLSAFVRQHDVVDAETLVELIRLDLEFRWRRGTGCHVEEYLEKFAQTDLDEQQIALLAYEEYRVRSQVGSAVSPGEYHHRLGVAVDAWPDWSATVTDAEQKPKAVEFPAVGDMFHGFELIGVLGRGAFGAVFLARETGLSRRLVAVKVSPQSDSEPNCLAQLQHTNIIPIYSLHQDGKLQSICMPFLGIATLGDLVGQIIDEPTRSLGGGRELISTVVDRRASTVVNTVPDHQSEQVAETLFNDMQSAGRGSAVDSYTYRNTILWVVQQIAEGLAYAHERGIVHGDLKPGNVLLSERGCPLILDFHLAQSTQQPREETLVGGTLPYMSPHHLKSLVSPEKVTTDCDLFSLGVLLHVALTGKYPFSTYGMDDASLLKMASERAAKVPSLRSSDSSLPHSVDAIVRNCLTAGRGGYQSAGQAAEDLQRHLDDLPLRHAPNTSWMERAGKWMRRHPRLSSTAGIGSLASILIVGLATVLWFTSSQFARAKAENSSREFVEQIESFRQNFATLDETQLPESDRIQALNNLLLLRTGGDANEYLDQLATLPTEMRNQELEEVQFAHYLLAYQRWKQTLLSAPESRQELADIAISGLSFVEATMSQPHPAIDELKHQFETTANGHPSAAREQETEKLLAPFPTRKALAMSALELYRQHRDKESLELVDRWIAEEPSANMGWLLKGRLLERIGKTGQAELCYSTAIDLKTESPWPYIHRGGLLLAQKRLSAAQQDYDQAIAIAPNQVASYLNRALVLIGLKDYQAALQDLDQAIELGCEQTRAHYLRYQVLRRLGNDEAAREAYRTFVTLEPQDVKSWLTRGMAQIRMKKPQSALADFRAALAVDGTSVDAYQNIATVHAEFLGETELAIEAMDNIIQLKPDDPIARVTRGVLRARAGDRVAAHQDANAVLEKATSADLKFRAAGVFALTSQQEPDDANVAVNLLRQAAFENAKLVWERCRSDHDLDSIRKKPAFQQLVQHLAAMAGEEEQP